ncbi:response regulator transcription factor [Pseudogemmobacter faecipullorum]|uniref:Response regulator transcription factor n=1 Tax=Pseudogemmobacter faecipullorum TaxID=2755041 RepID=A0ABS8CPQ8_9RHOB|nr:response regulator transcription factor [Pseudogemmobacter faecipullorum]MCB5411382.1 response regulator transcription factor [Pseudogemmobacter faecipullorum]
MQSLSQVPKQISLALADSNPLVLGAMSEIFDRDPRFSLVATTATAEGFLGAVMRVPVSLGIIDWRIPALGGQKLIEVLRDQPAAPRLIVYGDDQRGELPRKAMVAGAAGFVARSTSVDKLVDTCLAVANGQMVFPFLDVRDLQADPIQQLTRRERALLEALSKGMTNNDLAAEFGISANTVKFHLSNLYEKLGVQSRAQAIAFFYSARIGRDPGEQAG